MAAEFVKTNKGGSFLIVDQYLFRIDRNIPPVRRWKCKTNGCRATAKTELDQLIRASDTAEHGHANDEREIAQIRFRNTVKTAVSN